MEIQLDPKSRNMELNRYIFNVQMTDSFVLTQFYNFTIFERIIEFNTIAFLLRTIWYFVFKVKFEFRIKIAWNVLVLNTHIRWLLRHFNLHEKLSFKWKKKYSPKLMFVVSFSWRMVSTHTLTHSLYSNLQ